MTVDANYTSLSITDLPFRPKAIIAYAVTPEGSKSFVNGAVDDPDLALHNVSYGLSFRGSVEVDMEIPYFGDNSLEWRPFDFPPELLPMTMTWFVFGGF